MVWCAIPFCRVNTKPERQARLTSFHEFPVEPSLREKWVEVIRAVRPQWIPKETSKICGNHFKKGDFKEGLKIKALKPRVIPTVFEEEYFKAAESRRMLDEEMDNDSWDEPTAATVVEGEVQSEKSRSRKKRMREDVCQLEEASSADVGGKLKLINVESLSGKSHGWVGTEEAGCQTTMSGLAIAAYDLRIDQLRERCKMLLYEADRMTQRHDALLHELGSLRPRRAQNGNGPHGP